jgi:chromosome segregation ATPase
MRKRAKKLMTTTDQLNESGEAFSKELNALASVIFEKKAALDLMSSTMASVIKDSALLKSDVVKTSDVVKKETVESNEQSAQCSKIKDRLSTVNLSVQEADETLRLLLEQMEKSDALLAKIPDSEEDEVILRAQRILALPKSTRTSLVDDISREEAPAVMFR